jgi:SAM-dependent methyltransferase
MVPRKYKNVELADSAADTSARPIDVSPQSLVHVDCPVCGFFDSRVACSAGELAAHRRYLERFYHRRWRLQHEAYAGDRLTVVKNYFTPLVTCLGCGLLYRNPQTHPDGAAVPVSRNSRSSDTYLQAEYRTQRTWAKRKLAAVSRRLPTISRKETPRILEVGSFVGGFLAEGLAHGWDMFGVDSEPDTTAFCRARGLPVFCGTLEEAQLNQASFDAVVISNTFDRLPDPHATLAAATCLLRNGGLLVIRIPNGACFQWAMRRLPRLPASLRRALLIMLAWNSLLAFPYVYGYTLGTLTGLAESHGFRRTGCIPDRRAPVPTEYLNLGAVVEERCCEWMCRTVRQAPGPAGQFPFAPWLDVYFERACADRHPERSVSASDFRLGLLPVYGPAAFGQTHFNEGESTASSGRSLIMKDIKLPSLPNLIPRLLSGGVIRRADSRQEPVKKRGESVLTLDLICMRDARIGKG